MNIKKVRWRLQRELDAVLWSDFILQIKKAPVLPMQDEDRTEWLLWCCFTYNCTMQEANHRYKHNLEMMRKIAENIKNHRKERIAEKAASKGLKRRKRI